MGRGEFILIGISSDVLLIHTFARLSFFFFFCEKWLVESVGRLLFGNWGIGKICFKGKSILKFPRFFRVLNTFCLPRNRRRVTVLTVLLLIESNYFREFNTHISMVLTILFNSRILSQITSCKYRQCYINYSQSK